MPRSTAARSTFPPPCPAEAAEAAGESITGAAASAGQLPAGIASDLLASAHEAFTSGLNIAAAVGSVMFLTLAVLAVAMFRREPVAAEPDPEPASSTTQEVCCVEV